MLSSALCSLALLAPSLLSGMSLVTGTVTDTSGAPLPESRVFLEPGLTGALQETTTDAQGKFSFEDVSPGAAGVFAFHDGFSFSGSHLNVAVADEIAGLQIQLHQSDQLDLVVKNYSGKPVQGARVTRVALLGQNKVSIPLTKLTAFGFEELRSNAKGHVSIPHLPAGDLVALKVAHPAYAQEGVQDLRVAGGRTKVTLHSGVLVSGEVLAQGRLTPLAGATVTIRHAQPPFDSIATRTGATGSFSLRLKPGVYLCQASGAKTKSPGWERLVVPDSPPFPRLRLVLSGLGSIRGVLKDAVTEAPVEDARVSLTSNGNRAAVMRTGPTGEFHFVAATGENDIHVELSPGYRPPEPSHMRVTLKDGEALELPGIWLAPLPSCHIQVFDRDGSSPLKGALVSLLRPAQLGWTLTDAQGRVQLHVAQWPREGRIVGQVQSPTGKTGAIFALDRESAKDAKVQVIPFASVTGQVVNQSGKGVNGALVGGLFPGEENEENLFLWRANCGPEGHFQWSGIVPGVPQSCLALSGPHASASSKPFNPKPGESVNVGTISLEHSVVGNSRQGETLRWWEHELLSGELPSKKVLKKQAALILYCEPGESNAILESLEHIQGLLKAENLLCAVVVKGNWQKRQTAFPVLQGTPPAQADSYLLNSQAKIVMECYGIPPLAVILQEGVR